VADNLAFGRGAETIGETAILDAVQSAHFHEDVERMPGQFETPLGERGINLSGGQKQRLTLARGLLRDPRILLIDDALSAVDTHTESRILAHLRQAAR
jgi:ABC-type multidrug transport system fused ATPase/permease subunit